MCQVSGIGSSPVEMGKCRVTQLCSALPQVLIRNHWASSNRVTRKASQSSEAIETVGQMSLTNQPVIGQLPIPRRSATDLRSHQ